MTRTLVFGIYTFVALTLIIVGLTLWLTGHGTGDPYLTLGGLMAAAPPLVIWLRRKFGRG